MQTNKIDLKQIKLFKKIFSYLLLFGILFLGANLLMTFVFSSESIHGQSMEPNFTDGERVLSIRTAPIDRGCVIIFKAPDDPSRYYVKRVIGLSGDTVSSKDDKLYINGQVQNEPYLDSYFMNNKKRSKNFTEDFSLKTLFKVNKVPKDSLFVLGDNRIISDDSRTYGFIKKSSVVGVVLLRFWPIGHFHLY